MDTENAIAWRAEVIRALDYSAPAVNEPPAGSPQGGTSGKRRAVGCGR